MNPIFLSQHLRSERPVFSDFLYLRQGQFCRYRAAVLKTTVQKCVRHIFLMCNPLKIAYFVIGFYTIFVIALMTWRWSLRSKFLHYKKMHPMFAEFVVYTNSNPQIARTPVRGQKFITQTRANPAKAGNLVVPVGPEDSFPLFAKHDYPIKKPVRRGLATPSGADFTRSAGRRDLAHGAILRPGNVLNK